MHLHKTKFLVSSHQHHLESQDLREKIYKRSLRQHFGPKILLEFDHYQFAKGKVDRLDWMIRRDHQSSHLNLTLAAKLTIFYYVELLDTSRTGRVILTSFEII
ncbi:hypothetical protein BpHYR1_039043 [Brachionus plicatilis]|uniref:Uncharacterized protein n=1 Tax=Brachionus plicatilis TaxID=10195 RepID=A0A3M7R3Z9_BRAPC|nr:hypothetical protein BpHYR1_039043 [Brachionus plicatilis]